MNKKIQIFLLILSLIIATSCKKEKTERELKITKINAKSDDIFSTAIILINDSGYKINIDSVKNEYNKVKLDSAELGVNYALNFKNYAMELQFKKINASIARDKINQKQIDIENKKWNNSKAGKIQRKHPNWTNEECINLANRQVWIGMTIEMLKYSRGKPNHANPSNYGNGTEWQWCWDDYTPSCFYGKDNGVITSYN